MEEKACAFTGHREIESGEFEEVKNKTREAIESLINEGYTVFRVGGAEGFDLMAGDLVLELKEQYPQILLYVYVPWRKQSKNYNAVDLERYNRQLSLAQRKFLISEEYVRGCPLKRNRVMVNGCDTVIAYKRKETGGTAYTVAYAEKKQCRIINV